MPESTCTETVNQPRPVPFWRRRSWQLWRQSYLEWNDESQRGAWVQAEDADPDAFTAATVRRRLARVLDIHLGCLQLKACYRYVTGTALRVQLWDDGRHGPATMLVRVLKVTPDEGEWLHHCAFVADN